MDPSAISPFTIRLVVQQVVVLVRRLIEHSIPFSPTIISLNHNLGLAGDTSLGVPSTFHQG
jgi:hypothetical protein